MNPHQPAVAAAQRQSCDTDFGVGAAGGREADGLGGSVEFAPAGARMRTCRAPAGVDDNVAHLRGVDYEAAVADCGAGARMAAAADCNLDFAIARETDAGDDVVGGDAVGDRGWTLIDEAVPDLARRFV